MRTLKQVIRFVSIDTPVLIENTVNYMNKAFPNHKFMLDVDSLGFKCLYVDEEIIEYQLDIVKIVVNAYLASWNDCGKAFKKIFRESL